MDWFAKNLGGKTVGQLLLARDQSSAWVQPLGSKRGARVGTDSRF